MADSGEEDETSNIRTFLFGTWFDERIENINTYLQNPEEWLGNLNADEELEQNLRPLRGAEATTSDLEENIQNLEQKVQNTYTELLKADPATAEKFRKASPIDFNAEELFKERIDEVLSEETEMDRSKAIKEAFVLAHQSDYKLNPSELDNAENYITNFDKQTRSLTSQLSDAVFTELDESARAFFEYSRRKDTPPGMHSNIAVGSPLKALYQYLVEDRSSFSVDSAFAEDYDPEEELKMLVDEKYQDFENSTFGEGLLRDREELVESLSLGEGVDAVNITKRFNLRNKYGLRSYRSSDMRNVKGYIQRLTGLIGDKIETDETVSDKLSQMRQRMPNEEAQTIGNTRQTIESDSSYLEEQRNSVSEVRDKISRDGFSVIRRILDR